MEIPVVQHHTLLIWIMAQSFMPMKMAGVTIHLEVVLAFIPIRAMPMQMPIPDIVVSLINCFEMVLPIGGINF